MNRRTGRRALLGLIGLTCAVAACAALPGALINARLSAAPAPGPPAWPASIAAIGDSISQAADACCFYGEYPKYSWSTGDSTTNSVNSQYQRILAANPAVAGHNFNDSVSGSRVADIVPQAAQAVAQKAQYVTVLIGANDVCHGTPAAMTTTQAFTASFSQAMNTLEAGLPAGAHIFVSSVPNLYTLWQVGRNNPSAQAVWDVTRFCNTVLASGTTEATRQAVLTQVKAENAVLAAGCTKFANCRWDGGALFNTTFTAAQVSDIDFFHPSLAGQATIAGVGWAASWWGQAGTTAAPAAGSTSPAAASVPAAGTAGCGGAPPSASAPASPPSSDIVGLIGQLIRQLLS